MNMSKARLITLLGLAVLLGGGGVWGFEKREGLKGEEEISSFFRLPSWARPVPPDQEDGLGNQAGRYRIFFSPHARADVFLVDTATGHVWSPTTYSNVKGQPQVWVHEARLDTASDVESWESIQHRMTPEELAEVGKR